MNAGLSLSGVTLELGDGDETVLALDDVDLEVEPGQFVAVVGPSGSGKSSLLAVAGALVHPTRGSVRVAGEELGGLGARDRARVRRTAIGFVFQSGNLLPALSAADQLRLPLRYNRPARAGARDRLALLAEVGWVAKAERRRDQRAGGERQRVGIARALVTSPRVLLVDEPTAALDRQRSRDVADLLARETRQHAVATVMVTHDHDILGACDAVYAMADGRLSRTG
ncbi:MAG: ABC transporter ATP-binding protein [Angustibacter sp.]